MTAQEEVLVSILVTNFNYVRYIEQAVRSVAEQTYSPLELIIVDDGSKDNSMEVINILESQHSGRFRNFVVLSKTNGGFPSALNAGFRHVKGEVTIFFDADDIMFPTYVQRTTELLIARKGERVGFVYTHSILIDEQGYIILGSDDQPIERPSTNFDAELLKTFSYIPGCGATLTEALQKIFPFDEGIQSGEKHARWQAIVSKGYIGLYIPEPLFYYRQHSNNLSGVGVRTQSQIASGGITNHLLEVPWPTHKPGIPQG